ncbi:DoxX family protein [Alkalihalobacillus oceani]|uniref:DoxX family protein n=1 Tax=Halalkalibacter oceani TaxID=1653776 RepID=UPI002041A89E|nr:DoxX family protein [Halalkalibacter oceani]MCM3761087.1 DoxX family protein [Halalkalibacter oceani]
MIGQFLRENRVVAGVMVILRLYLGWAWLSSGVGKVTGGFHAGGYLEHAVANPVMQGEEILYPAYVTFLESVALPYAGLFSFVVAWGEILVGLGLITGILTSAAAFFGVAMNMAFLFAGTISTNPLLILISIFIMAAGANAGRFGGDRWVLPYLRRQLLRKRDAANLNCIEGNGLLQK